MQIYRQQTFHSSFHKIKGISYNNIYTLLIYKNVKSVVLFTSSHTAKP